LKAAIQTSFNSSLTRVERGGVADQPQRCD